MASRKISSFVCSVLFITFMAGAAVFTAGVPQAMDSSHIFLAGNGWGPGDGTGNDGDGPKDGTGFGPGPDNGNGDGVCTL